LSIQFIVLLQLQNPVAMQPTPYTPAPVKKSMASRMHIGKKGAAQVLVGPGALVSFLQKATAIYPWPTDQNQEAERSFVKVRTADGNEGWIAEYSHTGERMLHAFETQPFRAFISVLEGAKNVSAYAAPTLDKGSSNRNDCIKRLQPGELIEVDTVFYSAGINFYRMATGGGWVSESDHNMKKMVEAVTREPHWYTYVCNDKDGGIVRSQPTRSKTMNTSSKLSYRQRVIASEKVTFASGDAFIYLENQRGWMPIMKKDYTLVKMQVIQPVPPGHGGGMAQAGGPPMSQGYGGGPPKGYGPHDMPKGGPPQSMGMGKGLPVSMGGYAMGEGGPQMGYPGYGKGQDPGFGQGLGQGSFYGKGPDWGYGQGHGAGPGYGKGQDTSYGQGPGYGQTATGYEKGQGPGYGQSANVGPSVQGNTYGKGQGYGQDPNYGQSQGYGQGPQEARRGSFGLHSHQASSLPEPPTYTQQQSYGYAQWPGQAPGYDPVQWQPSQRPPSGAGMPNLPYR